MKKLMIAAAAVAMIGGAFADTLVYDFTANLKTTKGKGSKVLTSTWNLGWDGTDFWYNDAEFTDLPDYLKTIKLVGKGSKARYVPALVTDKKNYIVTSNLTDYAQVVAALKQLSDQYDQKSGGVWCQTVKTEDQGCYRVAGSQKIKAEVYTDDCCMGFVDEDGNAIDVKFQRFGALQANKATKVEGWITLGAGFDDGLVGAGQGSYSAKLWKDSILEEYVAGVKSISGNIVGTLVAPTCEACCDIGDNALAFYCDWSDLDGDETLGTAAYGTWSLKFNSGKTKKYNK